MPTNEGERIGQQESCKWSGKVSRCPQKGEGTRTRCRPNQQTRRMTRTFFTNAQSQHDTPFKGSAPKFTLLRLAPGQKASYSKGQHRREGTKDPCTYALLRKQKEHLPSGLTYCGRNALTTFQAPAQGCAQDNSKPKSSVGEAIIAAQHGCEQNPVPKQARANAFLGSTSRKRSVITLRNML